MAFESHSRAAGTRRVTGDLAASYAHCEAQLRAEDHDAWLAALFAPAAARPHLHALGAFALKIGHVRERVRQPIAGEIRLQWWQDVVDRERTDEATAHPVAAALVDTIARCSLPASLFGDILDAQRLALYDEPPADLATLERRCIALHGTPIRLAARVLGRTGKAIDAAADDAGVALGIAALLGRNGDTGSSRLVSVPTDLLRRDGSAQGEVAGAPAMPPRHLAVAELRAVAGRRLAALRQRRPDIGPAGPAFLTAALVEPRLTLAAKRLPTSSRHDAEVARWRRQWRMWRAARKGGVL